MFPYLCLPIFVHVSVCLSIPPTFPSSVCLSLNLSTSLCPCVRWVGFIKDYDGGTLMECYIHPALDYLNVRTLYFFYQLLTYQSSLSISIYLFLSVSVSFCLSLTHSLSLSLSLSVSYSRLLSISISLYLSLILYLSLSISLSISLTLFLYRYLYICILHSILGIPDSCRSKSLHLYETERKESVSVLFILKSYTCDVLISLYISPLC